MTHQLLTYDIAIQIASNLNGKDLFSLMVCSKDLYRSCKSNENLWQELCRLEMSVTSKLTITRYSMLSLDPYAKGAEETAGALQLDSWYLTYLDWRREMNGYPIREVKRMKDFWDGYIGVLNSFNATTLLKSIGHASSSEGIEQVALSLGRPLPKILALMYRFHNGQLESFSSPGFFPGHSKYGDVVSAKLLSVGCLPFIHDQVSARRIPSKTIHALTATSLCTSGDTLESVQLSTDEVLLFAFSMQPGNEKMFFAGDDGSVLVNTRHRDLWLYCHPFVPTGSTTTADLPKTSYLLDWLENMLLNLKSGVFWYEYYDSQSNTQLSDKFFTMYPIQRQLNLRSSAFQRLQRCQSSQITNGVEIRAASVFSPQESIMNTLVFVYTIRIRLLASHPSRDSRMTACRLKNRHWKIKDPQKHEQSVDGEGVIGLFPHLSIDTVYDENNYDIGWFTYQSCCSMSMAGGSMQGSIEFTAMDRDGTELGSFEAAVGKFEFNIPDYIL